MNQNFVTYKCFLISVCSAYISWIMTNGSLVINCPWPGILLHLVQNSKQQSNSAYTSQCSQHPKLLNNNEVNFRSLANRDKLHLSSVSKSFRSSLEWPEELHETKQNSFADARRIQQQYMTRVRILAPTTHLQNSRATVHYRTYWIKNKKVKRGCLHNRQDRYTVQNTLSVVVLLCVTTFRRRMQRQEWHAKLMSRQYR